MQIERFYLGCLAHASYLIHDGGEAAVIDPQRDIAIYLDYASQNNLSIRWVIETHLHADFVSGHVELGTKTGACVCLGAGSEAAFPHRDLADGDEIPLGDCRLRIVATPGHTEESISIVVIEDGVEQAVFTGDTLFIGDVGRPDLSPRQTPQQLAGMLFDSLHARLLTLPENTVVYPAHGAGSLCGRQMSRESSSTIGKERLTNYALQAPTREAFIELLTADLPPRPAYFVDEVERNRTGAAAMDSLPHLPPVSPSNVNDMSLNGVVVLDTRSAKDFGAAHVPGSINVGLSGQFASWAARILGVDTALLLVAEDEQAAHESRLRLARVGVERVLGFLDGGISAWTAAGLPLEFTPQITVQEVDEWLRSAPETCTILDVREASERSSASIAGSIGIPLPQLTQRMPSLPPDRTTIVHCKSGYRSSIAASLLQASGFSSVANMTGGYDAWNLVFGASAAAKTTSAG